ALLVGVGFCLLNPYHVFVFKTPGELYSSALSFLHKKLAARHMSISPFHPDLFGTTRFFPQPMGLTICDWAYYALLGLGLFSFAVNENLRKFSRGVTWAGFALLSIYQTRNIAFFAVVAAPITIMNMQEWTLAGRREVNVNRLNVALSMLSRFVVLI